MATNALVYSLALSMNRYSINANFMTKHKFNIFVAFPFMVNLLVANHFSIPNYYQELRPVVAFYIKRQNKRFLRHLKEQFKKYPEHFGNEEINVFLEVMQAADFNAWARTQTVYQFDQKVEEIRLDDFQEDPSKQVEAMLAEAMAKAKVFKSETPITDQGFSPANHPKQSPQTDIMIHKDEFGDRDPNAKVHEPPLNYSTDAKDIASDQKVGSKSLELSSIDSTDLYKH